MGSPFSITILDNEVNLTRTPPLQVAALLKEHARIVFDQKMFARLALGRDLHEYRNGVDWEIVRRLLNGQGVLSPAERRVFGVVAVGGLWPEERRWKA